VGLKLYKSWWSLLIKGVLVTLLGLSLLLIRNMDLHTFSLIVGLIFGFSGLSMVYGGYSQRVVNYEWTWWLLEGLIDIIVALFLIIAPFEALPIFGVVVGIWAVLMGLIQLVTAINIQFYIIEISLFVVVGLIALITGIVMVYFSITSLNTILWMFGMLTLIYGSLQIYISFQLRKIIIEEIGEIGDVYL
jgi:uncharacterized membrane protein HdeD (DUF308 family)